MRRTHTAAENAGLAPFTFFHLAFRAVVVTMVWLCTSVPSLLFHMIRMVYTLSRPIFDKKSLCAISGYSILFSPFKGANEKKNGKFPPLLESAQGGQLFLLSVIKIFMENAELTLSSTYSPTSYSVPNENISPFFIFIFQQNEYPEVLVCTTNDDWWAPDCIRLT